MSHFFIKAGNLKKLGILQVLSMVLIREIVRQALGTGYLTMEAEDMLRQRLTKKYELEDFNAFIALQHAAMSGWVKQESRQWLNSEPLLPPK